MKQLCPNTKIQHSNSPQIGLEAVIVPPNRRRGQAENASNQPTVQEWRGNAQSETAQQLISLEYNYYFTLVTRSARACCSAMVTRTNTALRTSSKCGSNIRRRSWSAGHGERSSHAQAASRKSCEAAHAMPEIA
jgi:hypothetical protein